MLLYTENGPSLNSKVVKSFHGLGVFQLNVTFSKTLSLSMHNMMGKSWNVCLDAT